MTYEKGQIILIPITFDDGVTKARFFLVQQPNNVFPIIEGNNITSIGDVSTRKRQFLTNVPLIPNSENNLVQPSVVKMNQKFILDSRKTIRIFGHLSEDEQEIISRYEKIFQKNGLVKTTGLEKFNEQLQKQYNLYKSILADDPQETKRLLLSGVNELDLQNGEAPLHVAIKSGSSRCVDELIKSGAFVDSLDAKRNTPLYYAIKNDDVKSAGLLLNAGANINLKNGDGIKLCDCVCSRDMKQLIDSYSIEKKNNTHRSMHL
jgi:mRNA-degrading endonuclease toxin of MazEF toxin-antitoxin module